jgi:hypothetical protein
VNVTLVSTFERLGFQEKELMKTNMSLSAFTGEVTEAKGVISVELMVGRKTMSTTLFGGRGEGVVQFIAKTRLDTRKWVRTIHPTSVFNPMDMG